MNTLTKWGYQFDWPARRDITITKKPETAQERLGELMMRQFGMDVQVDVTVFARFLYLLLTYTGFDSMPWFVREAFFQMEYGIHIAESTLRKWASHLIEHEVLLKGDRADGECWKTSHKDGTRVREHIDPESAGYLQYKARRTELLDQYKKEDLSSSEVWKQTYRSLWGEFNCCYYFCPRFAINALGHDIDEVIDWMEKICGEMDN